MMENVRQAETSKSIFRNIVYGFSTWIIPLILSFFATRIIVKTLGDKDYGIYALVLGFIGYSFNFSFGRAITKYIAEYRVSGENEKIKDVVSATFFINLAVGIFGVSIIIFISKWLVVSVYQIEEANQEKTILALHLAAAIVFFLMMSQIFNAVLQGIHRFDVYSNIFNLNTIVMLAGNIYLALNGYGFLGLLVWNLVISALTCVIVAVISKRLLPEFGINLRLKPEVVKLVLVYSAGIIGYQILANLLMLFERGWITRQLGAENLTYYVVPMLLSFYIHAFVSSIVLVVFPLASELKNNREKLLRLYTKSTKIVCFFVFFMATTLMIESKLFLTLWLGAEFADKTYLLLIIHTVTFSLVAIQTVSWQMTEGLGYPGYNLIIFVICLIINVLLVVGLTPGYGNIGVAFGRLAGFGTMFFSIYYVEKWFFQRVQTIFWLKLIGALAVSAVFSAIVEKSIISYFQISWLTFVSATICGGIIYCLILWVLGFITDEEKLLVRRILNR
ncbi:MAG: oligosaccharide flippase family protein [Pyrinomonadaceae bacterium]